MATPDLTIENALREYLSYNPESGFIFWIKRPGMFARVGSEAGSISKRGYRSITFKGRYWLAHRVAFFLHHGWWPPQIDHINGVKSDNRIGNLRVATHSMNRQNIRKAYSHSRHGFLGATPRNGRWIAVIKAQGKRIHIGTFDTPEDAAEAYLMTKRKLHEGCTI